MNNEQKSGLPALPMVDVYDLVKIGDIVNHLKKAVTENWCYEMIFNKGTPKQRIVRGMGIIGAMETAIIIAKLSKGQHVIRPLELMKLEETAETWDAVVKVGLFVVGIVDSKPVELLLNTALGYCNQSKLGKRKDGSIWVIEQPDKLAASKAQRMGIEKLIPDKWKEQIIDIAVSENKIKRENGENTSVGGEDEAKGNSKKATEKQIDLIMKLVKSEFVNEATKDHYMLAVDKGMNTHQASRAIQTLSKIVESGKKKKGENGQSLL